VALKLLITPTIRGIVVSQSIPRSCADSVKIPSTRERQGMTATC
jgi:hypothetical protein